jgi:hypothetical protein
MDENIYIYLMFSGVAIITILCKICLKSKCDQIELCGLLKIHRDIEAEEHIEMKYPSPEILQEHISNVGTTSIVLDKT